MATDMTLKRRLAADPDTETIVAMRAVQSIPDKYPHKLFVMLQKTTNDKGVVKFSGLVL